MKALKENKIFVGAAFFVLLVCALAAAAPWITPFQFDVQNVDRVLLAPNGTNWMGTDNLGRDLFSRVIYGARVSVAVGLLSSLLTLVIGTVIGAIAGYSAGRLESLLMRFTDLVQSIPPLILMILVMLSLESTVSFKSEEGRSVFSLVVALSLVGWVTVARLVRGQVRQIKEMSFVESARAAGAGPLAIIGRHVLPNIQGPLIVLLTFQIPSLVLYESFLSFIGLGLQPPYSSWGVLANEGWRSLNAYPHLILFPGIAIFLTMLAFNFVGEGLRDALDPKTGSRQESKQT